MSGRPHHRSNLDSSDIRVLERLTPGTSGTIWLAHKKGPKELCALKVVRKDEMHSTIGVDTWRRTFFTAKSERSNFILSPAESLETQSEIFLLTAYAVGGDIQSYVQQNGKLALATAQFYAAELCHAIGFLHQKGLIHRNLGLEHVLLTANGHIRLTGFGCCKGSMAAESRTTTFCGGIALAPEMLLDEPYGRSVDWWAFGISLFEMLEAASPFRGEDMDDVFDELLDDSKPEYPLDMPESATSILQQLLLRDPKKRLGAHGTEQVKTHTFFEGVEWDDVAQERLLPPIIPAITDRQNATESSCETLAIPSGKFSTCTLDQQNVFVDF